MLSYILNLIENKQMRLTSIFGASKVKWLSFPLEKEWILAANQVKNYGFKK